MVEMKKKLNSTGIILIGVVIFLLGCIQPYRYEMAKENGYEVDATIVEVKTKEEDGVDGSPSSTAYIVYADYEVDGEEYEHVRVGKYYDTDKYYVGKTIKVVVNPNSPNKPMFEGGILCVAGFLILIVGIVGKIRKKKAT